MGGRGFDFPYKGAVLGGGHASGRKLGRRSEGFSVH